MPSKIYLTGMGEISGGRQFAAGGPPFLSTFQCRSSNMILTNQEAARAGVATLRSDRAGVVTIRCQISSSCEEASGFPGGMGEKPFAPDCVDNPFSAPPPSAGVDA